MAWNAWGLIAADPDWIMSRFAARAPWPLCAHYCADSHVYVERAQLNRFFRPWHLVTISFFQDLQIISTDDNQVVAAIQDWHQNDSYNLYMSESRGLFFTLMLESVVSSGGPEGNIMIDLYEVGSDSAAGAALSYFYILSCWTNWNHWPGFVTAAGYRTMCHVH